MENYTAELARWFRSHADPMKAAPMAAYMRDKFPFLGIKAPDANIQKRMRMPYAGLWSERRFRR